MTQIIVTATVDGVEVHRQTVREQDMQGVVSMAAYHASMLNRDPSTNALETFPEIVVKISPATKDGK